MNPQLLIITTSLVAAIGGITAASVLLLDDDSDLALLRHQIAQQQQQLGRIEEQLLITNDHLRSVIEQLDEWQLERQERGVRPTAAVPGRGDATTATGEGQRRVYEPPAANEVVDRFAAEHPVDDEQRARLEAVVSASQQATRELFTAMREGTVDRDAIRQRFEANREETRRQLGEVIDEEQIDAFLTQLRSGVRGVRGGRRGGASVPTEAGQDAQPSGPRF